MLPQRHDRCRLGGSPNPEIAHVAALSPDCRRADHQPEADPADGGGGGLGDVLFDPLAGERWGAGLPPLRLSDVLGLPAAKRGAAVPLFGLPARLQPDVGHPVRLPQAGDPRLSGGGRDLLRRGQGQGGPSRDLDVQYKTAFVLAHKIREAMAFEVKNLRLGGAGRHVEIDGCYVGGYVRPENRKAERRDLRLAENGGGRGKVVVVTGKRPLSGTSLGGPLPAVFVSEDAAASFIRARV